MGIRLKILLVFILCFGLMAGVSLILLKQSVNESYDVIERGDIAADMGRVERSFEAAAASLKNQTNDWAVWDEMYRYAIRPSPDWAKESIGEHALGPADISMAMVFARNGRLLSANAIRHEGKKLDLLAPELTPYLDRIKKGTKEAHCGIIRIEAGLMLTCWAGIVQSDGNGEVVGTVVMGRLLEASRLKSLQEQTRLSFALNENPGLPEQLTRWSGLLSPGPIGSGDFWTSHDPDWYHLYYLVQDILGQDVGVITLDVPRLVHKQGLTLYRQVRQQVVWTVLVMTVLLGLSLHFMLIRRLGRFAKQINALEANSTWDARIDVGGKDELGLVATNFNKLLALIKSQMEGLRELLDAKEASIQVIKATQAQLILSEKEALKGQQRVNNLLNNSGQGFLSFGGDLLIAPEISRACEGMLGFSPTGRNVSEVFVGNDPAKAELFCSIIAAVLDEPDPDIRESMLSLLPAEISRDGILLKAEYKPLENGRFMAVLTDITEERRLEALLQTERRRLEFIVLAVSDKRNFFDAIDAFREFLARGLPRILNAGETDPPQVLATRLYREIHTHKGLLNQFSFINTPKVLHEIETGLSGLLSRGDALTRRDIADIVSPRLLEPPFDGDLAVLTHALGKEFLEHGKGIALSGSQASALEKLAARLLQGDAVDTSALEIRTLLNEIVALRKVTFKAVLMDFDGLVKQIAKRQGKEVAPIEVQGDADIWIDPQPYQAFFHSLGHIFRNAVIHGLETPEARWSARKNDHGKITCQVELEKNTIKLSIADDGAGIDLEALRERAVAAGLHTSGEASALPDEEIARLIFRGDMSTQDTVTDVSGRGVGLAAVLDETRKLGGDVVIRTVSGQGTQFLFSLPLQESRPAQNAAMAFHGKLNDDVELVMRSIIAKTRDYFEGEHGICVAELEAKGGESRDLRLLDMTAVIGMGGRVNLWVAFSLEEGLVNAVYEQMSAGFNDRPDEVEKYRGAAIGEVVNTILGHCTMDIQHLDRQGISMTPPVILGRGKPIPSVDNAMHHTQSLSTGPGRLKISIVGPREIFDNKY